MSDSLRPPWAAAHQASLSLAISQSLPKFMSIASMMSSSHLILWCPVLLPSIFPSIRVFSNESAVYIRWPKYWSLASASVLPLSIQGWFPLGLTGLILWNAWALFYPIHIKELLKDVEEGFSKAQSGGHMDRGLGGIKLKTGKPSREQNYLCDLSQVT